MRRSGTAREASYAPGGGSWSSAWLVLVALAGACVNLTPPPGLDADTGAPDGPPTDPDAGPPDTRPVDARPPDSPVAPDGAPDGPTDGTTDGPGDATADVSPDLPADGPPDLAPDLSPDRPPDLPPDLPPDTPVDRPPDTTPDTAPPVTCPTEAALLLCLRFPGTLTDESAPSATVTGNNVTFEAGIDGQAARMGTSSTMRVASGWGNVDDLTLEAWVRLDRLPGSGQRAGVLDEDENFGLFVYPDGDVTCSSSSGMATAAGAVAAGQWVAISCTLSGRSLVLWIDGVARAQAQTDGIANDPAATVAIGGNLPSGDPLEGLIDNVRLWNRARTAQEICDFAPTCP
jgi:hypothetical protein